MREVWRREGKRAFARRVLGPLLVVRYKRWIAKNEPTPALLTQQRAAAKAFPCRPHIIVVIRVREAIPSLVDASIRSVVNQSYDSWELRLIEDRPGHSGATTLLSAWAAKDPRIRIERPDGYREPAVPAVTHEAGSAEFVTVLNPGDTLAPSALFEIAHLVNRRAAAALIYFDEDRLSADGRTRAAPWFKPDWSPEMLLSVNYLAHSVVRRQLLVEAGALAEALEGADTWNLTLRCTEHTQEIYHIPKVLYHCHRAPGSSAEPWDRSEVSGDLRYVEAHCQRLGLADAQATFLYPGIVRVTWRSPGLRVSIIIPNKNRAHILRSCIASITERTSYTNFEILIVDTGSTDRATLDYYASLTSDPRMRIVDHPGKFNYSAANNAGARLASGSVLLFLNNDTEALESDWLEEMVRWAERPDIGVVGAKLLYPNGTIQHAGVIIGMNGLTDHIYRGVHQTYTGMFGSVDWYRNYMAVTGACMMVRRDVFEEVGGFDEAYEVGFSDVEICLRVVTHGYRVVYAPFARLLHHESATRGNYYPPSDTKRALEHMRDLVVSGDPYFHPNLSHESLVPVLPRRGDRPREVLLKRRIARG